MAISRRGSGRRHGAGELSEELYDAVIAEGVRHLEERLRGSLTRRHFRTGRQRIRYEKTSIQGAVAVTSRRLVVWVDGGMHINVPLAHPLRAGVEVRADGPDQVCFAYTAETFRTDRSGEVEVRLRTARAERLVGLLTEPAPNAGTV